LTLIDISGTFTSKSFDIRQGLDKVRSPGRDRLPFVVRVRARDGSEQDLQAGAVIDASGTWAQPNPLGANGLPALGERLAAAHGQVLPRHPRAAPGRPRPPGRWPRR